MPAVDPHPALAAAAAYIRTLVDPDEEGLRRLMDRCTVRTVPRRHYLSRSGDSIDEVYYIHEGLVRVVLVDPGGTEHTSHLAYEGLLFAEYTAYLTSTPAAYELQALEDTTVVAMPRAAIEWGYAHMRGGERLGRLVAEQYFIYLDRRVRGLLTVPPQERYAELTRIFPGVHARVPQHMLASYLGITPEYLSRMKRAALGRS